MGISLWSAGPIYRIRNVRILLVFALGIVAVKCHREEDAFAIALRARPELYIVVRDSAIQSSATGRKVALGPLVFNIPAGTHVESESTTPTGCPRLVLKNSAGELSYQLTLVAEEPEYLRTTWDKGDTSALVRTYERHWSSLAKLYGSDYRVMLAVMSIKPDPTDTQLHKAMVLFKGLWGLRTVKIEQPTFKALRDDLNKHRRLVADLFDETEHFRGYLLWKVEGMKEEQRGTIESEIDALLRSASFCDAKGAGTQSSGGS